MTLLEQYVHPVSGSVTKTYELSEGVTFQQVFNKDGELLAEVRSDDTELSQSERVPGIEGEGQEVPAEASVSEPNAESQAEPVPADAEAAEPEAAERAPETQTEEAQS